MKVAVLVLVLANFAVFAWLHWTQDPRQEAALVPRAAVGKKLALLPKMAVAPVSSAASRASAIPAGNASRAVATPSASTPAIRSLARQASGTAPDCLVWPLASRTSADALVARLDAGGIPARIFTRKESVPGDYRVFLDGFAGRPAAERAVAILRRGGMNDLYLLPPAGTRTRGLSLSLGVFSDREHAEHRAARVHALGFKPKIGTSMRVRERRYLEARLPAATSVSAVLRATGVARKPRRTACRASSAASVAAPGARSVP